MLNRVFVTVVKVKNIKRYKSEFFKYIVRFLLLLTKLMNYPEALPRGNSLNTNLYNRIKLFLLNFYTHSYLYFNL